MANPESKRLAVDVIARVDKLEKAMAKARKSANDNIGAIEKRGERFARKFEADIGGAARRATGHLAAFGKGMLAGVFAGGAAGLASQISAVAKGVASIGDEARRAGLSIKAFQELKFVAEQNRIGVDSLVDGIKELNLRADEWILTGAGPAAEAFQRLGYDSATLATKLKDPSALFSEIIGKLGQLDKAAQIRIADEIFGGTGGEKFVQLIEQGEQGIRGTIAAANDLGIVLDDELIAKADDLDKKFQAVTTTVGTGLKRAIVEAASALSDFVNEFERLNSAYQQRLNAADAGALAGSLAGQRNYSTPKGDRLGGGFSVPFSPLPADNLNRRVQLEALRDNISRIESGGNYRAMGPITSSGDRAFGRYQVMGANIAEWSKKALGTALTSDQFLNNPQFQDKIFDHIMSGYIDRFGAEGAAQAWFGGPGAVGKTGRTDQLGTSVGSYGQMATAGIGEMTDAWSGLRTATDSAATSTAAVADQYDILGTVGVTALDGLANALADGKVEGRELVQILANVAKQLMSMPTVGGGMGGGGFLSSLLGLVPGFASGTNSAPGGLAMVGERGPELVNLPRGSQVIPNHQLPLSGSRSAGGGSVVNMPITINAPGADAAALARVERSVQDLRKAIPEMVDRRTNTRETRKTRA